MDLTHFRLYLYYKKEKNILGLRPQAGLLYYVLTLNH